MWFWTSTGVAFFGTLCHCYMVPHQAVGHAVTVDHTVGTCKTASYSAVVRVAGDYALSCSAVHCLTWQALFWVSVPCPPAPCWVMIKSTFYCGQGLPLIMRLSPLPPRPLLSDDQVYILLWEGPSLCQVLLSCCPLLLSYAVVSRAAPSSSRRVKWQGLHAVVGRALPSLRHHPVDVLAGVLDVARLAVDAVLSVDLETPTAAILQLHVLVHAWTTTA